MDEPYTLPSVIQHSLRMARSFELLAGAPLIEAEEKDVARALYEAPFVLVSHGVQADPVFCYANRTAQRLWGYEWERFTALPSRLSAEPQARTERGEALARALESGMVRDYSGIRITADGRRFRIENASLWNVTDEHGARVGQAAMFDRWTPLP